MHPINKLNFGPTGIKVSFNNGNAVVDGWIVKQTSWAKFEVTSDGVTDYVVRFISTSSTPQVGEFTILVYPTSGGTEHAKRLDEHHIETFEGNRYIWVAPPTVPAAGNATLAHY